MVSWSREGGDIVLVKTGRPHRCAGVGGGAHGQLLSGEGAHGQGKEQRKEVRGEECGAKGMNTPCWEAGGWTALAAW